MTSYIMGCCFQNMRRVFLMKYMIIVTLICGDKSDRKSIKRYKQLVVALSSCEAEYIVALIGSLSSFVWLENLMT
ncbi:hypothetical protein CR513_14669, partial [Mucuna pruriens]